MPGLGAVGRTAFVGDGHKTVADSSGCSVMEVPGAPQEVVPPSLFPQCSSWLAVQDLLQYSLQHLNHYVVVSDQVGVRISEEDKSISAKTLQHVRALDYTAPSAQRLDTLGLQTWFAE